MGRWHDESGGGVSIDAEADEAQLLLELGAAAVQGRAVTGERDLRAGRGTRDEPFVKAPLCADVDGFSLHAGVVVSGHDRERLEKLLRYAGRPAIAESRLALLPDGRVAYSLKKRWKDGSTTVVMSPQAFLGGVGGARGDVSRGAAKGRSACAGEAATRAAAVLVGAAAGPGVAKTAMQRPPAEA